MGRPLKLFHLFEASIYFVGSTVFFRFYTALHPMGWLGSDHRPEQTDFDRTLPFLFLAGGIYFVARGVGCVREWRRARDARDPDDFLPRRSRVAVAPNPPLSDEERATLEEIFASLREAGMMTQRELRVRGFRGRGGR